MILLPLRHELVLGLDLERRTAALRRGPLKLVVNPGGLQGSKGWGTTGQGLESVTAGPGTMEDCFDQDHELAGHGIKNNRVDKVTSAKQCQEECLGRQECRFWTWNSGSYPVISNTCWLKSSDKGRKVRKDNVSGPKECEHNVSDEVKPNQATRDVCFEVDVDYTGGGIPNNKVAKVSSPSLCQAACQERSDCSFWTLNSGTQTCWLKSSHKGRKGVTGKVSGPKECLKRSRGQTSEGCLDVGYNYAGQGLEDNRLDGVTSPEGCQEKCQPREGCLFWTCNSRSETCWLKSGKDGRNEDKGKVSGPRDCGVELKTDKEDSVGFFAGLELELY